MRKNKRKKAGIVDEPRESRRGFARPHFAHLVRTVRSKAQPLLDKIPAAKIPFADKIPFLNRPRRTWHNLEGSEKADSRSFRTMSEKPGVNVKTTISYFTTARVEGAPQMPPRTAFVSKGGHVPIIIPGMDRSSSQYSAEPIEPGTETYNPTLGSQFLNLSPTDGSGTIRSRMPDAYFNQSELARQPSDAYDPQRRQVHRASALSSISSGFGDADIVVAPAPSLPIQSTDGLRPPPNRESIYTETSEDSPPKFRSVTSWVNQQSGRVKRAAERDVEDEDVPPIPDVLIPGAHRPPPEGQLNMMQDDGQSPRRPADFP